MLRAFATWLESHKGAVYVGPRGLETVIAEWAIGDRIAFAALDDRIHSVDGSDLVADLDGQGWSLTWNGAPIRFEEPTPAAVAELSALRARADAGWRNRDLADVAGSPFVALP